MALQAIFLLLVLVINVISGQPSVPAAGGQIGLPTTTTGDVPPPPPPVVGLAASSGAGNWQFAFNFLGCVDGTLSCSAPTNSRYAPEDSPYYVAGKGTQMEVRLWWKMNGAADFDLSVEQWDGARWNNMGLVPQRPTNWQEKIVFTARSGWYYRFKALRRSGASYYVLSWKYS